MDNKHKYRVSVYLGKQNHEKLSSMAKAFGMPLSALVRVLLDNGMALADAMEKQETKSNGEK